MPGSALWRHSSQGGEPLRGGSRTGETRRLREGLGPQWRPWPRPGPPCPSSGKEGHARNRILYFPWLQPLLQAAAVCRVSAPGPRSVALGRSGGWGGMSLATWPASGQPCPVVRCFYRLLLGSFSAWGDRPLDTQAASWEVWESWSQACGQKEVQDGSLDHLASQRLATALLLPGTRGCSHLWTCCAQTCVQLCSEHQAQPGPASPRLWEQKYSDPIDLVLLGQIDPSPINIWQRPFPWVPARKMNCRAIAGQALSEAPWAVVSPRRDGGAGN